MLSPATMQEASTTLPVQSHGQGLLFIYDTSGVNIWGRQLTKKQVSHLLKLLKPEHARQITFTLRPDVHPKVTFDGVEVFQLFRPPNTIPNDPEIACLYRHPLVDYRSSSPSLVTRIAEAVMTAHQK